MITDDLKHAKSLIEASIEGIEKNPDKVLVQELIEKCNIIEERYKELCKEIDEEHGDDDGTTYENGVSIEFYIEADWWHDVSLVLRKLKEIKT